MCILILICFSIQNDDSEKLEKLAAELGEKEEVCP